MVFGVKQGTPPAQGRQPPAGPWGPAGGWPAGRPIHVSLGVAGWRAAGSSLPAGWLDRY